MASTVDSSNAVPTTPTPTIIISVGPPLGTSMTSSSSSSTIIITSTTPFITSLPTTSSSTVMVSQPSSSATSSLTSATPSTNSVGANNGNSNNDGQGFPIGLIAGIVTGFSILMLVMGVLFVVLLRNKKIKVVSDIEAMPMRDQRSTTRAYYMPPPPALQQQQKTAPESEASTPVKSARFPPEVVTSWRVGTSSPLAAGSPRRSTSGDVNKPWPPTPRDSQNVTHTSPWPLREGHSVGGGHPEAVGPSVSSPISHPGRAINHPDPLRANGLSTPATETHAIIPFTPSKTALPQRGRPVSSQSPGEGSYRLARQQNMSASSTNPGGGGGGGNRPLVPKLSISTAADYDLQRISELTRADSNAHFALRPPPRRRPPSSGSEATKSPGEGRISKTPGLRLSGVSQGTPGPVDERGESQRESGDEGEEDPMLQRATWYGEGKSGRGGWGDSATPPRSRRRRFSQ